jgi:hypothetical protein
MEFGVRQHTKLEKLINYTRIQYSCWYLHGSRFLTLELFINFISKSFERTYRQACIQRHVQEEPFRIRKDTLNFRAFNRQTILLSNHSFDPQIQFCDTLTRTRGQTRFELRMTNLDLTAGCTADI